MKELLCKALKEQLPFVIYRKPNDTFVNAWFQHNNQLCTVNFLEKSCFVFAPFSGQDKVVFFSDKCTIVQEKVNTVEDLVYNEALVNDAEVDKQFHINLVRKALKAIGSGILEKVVLSRKEKVTVHKDLYETYYQRFMQKYPTAFVYWWFHPKVGMWMGATPEQFIKIDGDLVKTVALAGTMVDGGVDLKQVRWGGKEQEEQKVVTDFIVDCLKPFSKSVNKTEPFTHQAGTLLHIKTDIEAVLKKETNPYEIIEKIHPTPALCGFPKEVARDFIIENEGYDRGFYGGYLGEWQFNNAKEGLKADLFVNLRCMNINGSEGFLFLGGGINKDSNPENEFYETVNKSKTVKSIL